jgi:hypothetical protein
MEGCISSKQLTQYVTGIQDCQRGRHNPLVKTDVAEGLQCNYQTGEEHRGRCALAQRRQEYSKSELPIKQKTA